MILIIWAAIIIFIIVNESRKAKMRAANVQRINLNGQQVGPRVQTYTQASQNNGQRTDMARKQQELKARLTQRYGRPAAGRTTGRTQYIPAGRYTNVQNPQGDILSHAVANVRETEKDELKSTAEISEGFRLQRGDLDWTGVSQSPSSELMREIEDLIVMGYQVRMPGEHDIFERDFLAEGLKMLEQHNV